MTDAPQPIEEQKGWHKPGEEDSKRLKLHGAWAATENALSPEQLAALRESPPETLPEPEIGPQPAQTGAWYRPLSPASEPEQEPGYTEPGLFDQLAGMTPEQLGEFDHDRSGLLQGIQPDLGEFDDTRSGALAGIGAETETEEDSSFDESKSGAADGIEKDLGEFDASRSGALAGIGATADEETPEDGTQVSSDTGAQAAQEQPLRDDFVKVEDQVTALREQYANGQITRDQLQAELRKLMILDDAGRWWMLGLESNSWYRYDGKDWVADDPPRKPVTEGQAVPTETGIQEVLAAGAQASAEAQEVEDASMPLPNKVPVDDLGATLVNQSAIQLDDHRPSEAPTQPGMQVAGDDPFVDAEGGVEATVPSFGGQDAAIEGGAAFEPQAGDDFVFGQSEIPDFERGPIPEDSQPLGTKMNGIQPDYSEAFGGYRDRAALRKWSLRLAIFGGVGTLLLIFIVVVALLGFYLSVVNSYSDAIADLDERAAPFETSIIYDGEENILARFNDPRGGARQSVPLEEISPFLIHATISTEDETFYENPGFSLFGIARAVVRNLQTSGGGGGASTITQQLTRAIVLDAELASQRTSTRKIQEIIVAAEIARQYSKNEILEFYLNEIYYGNQAYGIEAASRVYFNKRAADLNLAEAAFLAGLPQAPAVYDPVVNRQTAVARMEDVLRLMTEANGNGCLQMQHEGYNTQPFCVTQDDITETYAIQIAQVQIQQFTAPTFEARYPHFVNYVWQNLEREYGAQRIYSSGFRVYTTLVPSIQDTAQQAVIDEIPVTPGANNGSVVAIRPRDGAVLAMVGSANFDDEEIDGQVNVAFTPQQPGSSIKPLVYLTAFEASPNNDYFYPGTILWDVPSCLSNYCPTNFNNAINGPVNARFALGQSLNIPAVKALNFVGTERFTTTLERFGYDLPGETPVQAGLPSALGAVDVFLFDHVQAFATLANGGVRQNAYAIQRIEDINGNIVFEANPTPEGLQIVSPQHAYLITSILSDESVKLSSSLSIPGWDAAAKTGTTNDNRDVWTMGYTTELAVGVWVGRTDNQPMASTVFGSNTAAPIWNKTMTAGLAGLSPTDFPQPEGLTLVTVCSDTGALFEQATCPSGSSRQELSIASQPPPAANESFVTTAEVDSFSGLLANANCTEYVEVRSFIAIDDGAAITWINDTAAGNGWAAERGIEVPITQPPTESCQPGMPRPQVVLSSPFPGMEVSGVMEMRGTVSVPNFASYEFQLANADVAPDDFSGAIGQIYGVQQPGANSFLGSVDFSSFPNGNYILRLVGRSTSGATATSDVTVFVNNNAAPPAPQPTFAPTATDIPPVQQQQQPTATTQTSGSLGGGDTTTTGNDTTQTQTDAGADSVQSVAPSSDGQ